MGRNASIPLILLLLFVCLALPWGSTSATVGAWLDANRLQNPGFEVQARYVDFWPASWFPEESSPAAYLVWDDTQSHEGSRSVRITLTSPDDANWSQLAPVQPDTDYRLSGWIKTEGVASANSGANLAIYGPGYDPRTQSVFGTTDWTYVDLTFSSGMASEVYVLAQLGDFWSSTTTGTAWFDELRLESLTPPLPPEAVVFLPVVSKARCVSPNPSWKILVLLYTSTDFAFIDGVGQPHHFAASVTQAERNRIAYTVGRFAMDDIPALDSCNMQPTVTIRNPDHPLTNLTPVEACNDYAPSPSDAAPDRDPAFDSVITIWDGSGTDLLTGQDMTIHECGYAWGMATGQTYAAIPVDFVSLITRNIFKHEWGHSILFYYEAAGVAPRPAVDNHINDSDNQYVHCPTGQPYILEDESDLDPIPNSIYNNLTGFTHDYYSGQTATPDQPSRCLGITPGAWATGGPVTRPPGDESVRTWQSPSDDVITTVVPARASLRSASGAIRALCWPNILIRREL